MRVIVYCGFCTDIDEDNPAEMKPDGHLFTSPDKTQSQVYSCEKCKGLVQVSINTTKNQEDE